LLTLLESEEVEMEEKDLLMNTLYTSSQVNVDLVDVCLSEKSQHLKVPVLSWNKKDFKKLKGECYTPDELI
jgi:hypothetical protein